GREGHAGGVGSWVRLYRHDFERIALRRFDSYRADGVPDPHPVLGSDLRSILPRVRGVAGPSVGVRVEVEVVRQILQIPQAPQASQGDGKVIDRKSTRLNSSHVS